MQILDRIVGAGKLVHYLDLTETANVYDQVIVGTVDPDVTGKCNVGGACSPGNTDRVGATGIMYCVETGRGDVSVVTRAAVQNVVSVAAVEDIITGCATIRSAPSMPWTTWSVLMPGE